MPSNHKPAPKLSQSMEAKIIWEKNPFTVKKIFMTTLKSIGCVDRLILNIFTPLEMLYGVVYSIYNEESMGDIMRIWQSIVSTKHSVDR